MNDALRKLPKVDRVLAHPRLRELALARTLVRRFVSDAIAAERERLLAATDDSEPLDTDAVAERVRARLDQLLQPHPRRVLNGTGVILHTNLGRAPLSTAAGTAVLEAIGTCDLELELDTGKRGSRLTHLRPLLAALFEAEDAHVVNNGAAALLLACTALPGRRASAGAAAIILSRGQHIEIGDSFRVADMAAAGGVPVVAVGSTNRTHLRDYEAALDRWPGAALLWAHRSNFSQAGFVTDVALADLARLARTRDVPLIADLGSGSLGAGVPIDEPTVAAYLRDGASVVTFSGDKLLGGPQAGLLAGSSAEIAVCRRHPLARALRCDKLGLAALHATAIAHARTEPDTDHAIPDLPVHRMIATQPEQLRARAQQLCDALGWSPDRIRVSQATIGGGSLPGARIDSVALVVSSNAREAAAILREAEPPLLARLHDDQLWIDLRTLEGVDNPTLVRVLDRLNPVSGA